MKILYQLAFVTLAGAFKEAINTSINENSSISVICKINMSRKGVRYVFKELCFSSSIRYLPAVLHESGRVVTAVVNVANTEDILAVRSFLMPGASN